MIKEPLIECVPNFSEGRDQSVIDAIAQSIESVPGVKILHIDMGYDANRTVITFVGSPEASKEAAYRSILTATHNIDMRKHHGAHPRIGAVDVFPFVPLKNVSMQEAIDISVAIGRRIGAELNIPVYLYNQSAKIPYRQNLADVRAGEYEGLRYKLQSPDGKPDFGPEVMNEKSGAMIIGARNILVAYNINLKSGDIQAAKKIANQIREKNGGLKGVRAIGWYMPEFKCAQVPMNLVDIETTPLHIAFERCRQLAEASGIEINGSELVGLIPKKCLIDAADHFVPGNQMDEEEKIKSAVEILGLNAVKPFDIEKQIIEEALNRP